MAYEYIVAGKKVTLPVHPDKIAVRFKEPAAQAMRAAVIDPKPELGPFSDRLEVPNEKFTVVDVAAGAAPGPQRFNAASATLSSEQEVARVAPVFDLGGTQAIATDRLLVGFRKSTSPKKAHETLQKVVGADVEIIEELSPGTGEYKVRLPESLDPFEALEKLSQEKSVQYAEPDFVLLGTHVAFRTEVAGNPGGVGGGTPGPAAPSADPLLALQYAMKNTRADKAWTLTSGSPTIKIAILDEGVDAVHADLQSAIVGQFDGLSGTAAQQPNPWDGHGTACAGLAAAIPNAIGVRGIGGGCSLLAVRIARSAFKGAPWTTSNGAIQSAIDWAWQNGADVLSNSWGGGTPSSAIINAFERARLQGRGGKGCVIVIAAGNDNGPVSFPGDLPNVLTVAASNEADEPKTKTSSDGETWWGSNFGPEIDVAAPGVHNYTTDISGAAGYNPGSAFLSGDYVHNFNGTSSATPLVAGAAGLILSVAPGLTESKVRSILKQTADKVGSVVYATGRNDHMGHGRINVLKAVRRAQRLVTP